MPRANATALIRVTPGISAQNGHQAKWDSHLSLVSHNILEMKDRKVRSTRAVTQIVVESKPLNW